MATPPLYRMSFQNANDEYYYAEQDAATGVWTVSTSVTPVYLDSLPRGWDEHKITYKRNMDWLGVFRSLATSFEFSGQAYGILRDIYHNSGWIQAQVYVTIKKCADTESSVGALDFWRYETYYESLLNFNEINIDEEVQTVKIGILDGELNDLLKAYSGTQFNTPIWTWDGAAWQTDAVFMEYAGPKLLFQADYESAATVGTTLDYIPSDSTELHPFNMGKWVSGSSVTFSRYTLPALTQKTVLQNNGASTFIGNDILSPFLLIGGQEALASAFSDGRIFDNATKQSYTIKSLLQDSTGAGANVTLYFEVSAKFTGDTFSSYDTVARTGGTNVKFAVFEIDANNNPTTYAYGGTTFTYFYDLGYALPADIPGGSTGTHTVSAPPVLTGGDVIVKKDKLYVFAILYDDFSGGGLPDSGGGADHYAYCKFDYLTLKVYSKYNSGTSSPVDGPRFPASTVAAFRPEKLWRKLVPCLESNSTDAYGFPIIPAIPEYTGDATALFDYNELGAIANDVLVTSGNNLRMINGQPYITTSIRDFFQFCKYTFRMGLSIENGTQLKIQPIDNLFDITTMILDLGTDIAKLKIYPYSDVAVNNIKVGYDKINTNNDFGVDGFCTELHYRTVITREVRDIDCKIPYNAEMYAIEKARAQKNSQPIQSPSADNQTFIIQADPSIDGTFDVYDPSGVAHTVDRYHQLTYPTAQSTDPLATTDPYVKGLYYPETAVNLPLSPARNAWRTGKYFRSIMHGQDGYNMQFQKQYQMLYDNSSVPLPGISTNLQDGFDEVQEVADIPVAQLGDPLFIPTVLEVMTRYPVNAYSLVNATPFGYIQGNWRGRTYKGFLLEINFDAKEAATVFKLLATPDMVFT